MRNAFASRRRRRSKLIGFNYPTVDCEASALLMICIPPLRQRRRMPAVGVSSKLHGLILSSFCFFIHPSQSNQPASSPAAAAASFSRCNSPREARQRTVRIMLLSRPGRAGRLSVRPCKNEIKIAIIYSYGRRQSLSSVSLRRRRISFSGCVRIGGNSRAGRAWRKLIFIAGQPSPGDAAK